MRDSYVGDFGKYALLNALAGDDPRLGVLWCRNSRAKQLLGKNATAVLGSADIPVLEPQYLLNVKSLFAKDGGVRINNVILFKSVPVGSFLLRLAVAETLK